MSGKYMRVVYGKCPFCLQDSEFHLTRGVAISESDVQIYLNSVDLSNREVVDAFECCSCGELIPLEKCWTIPNLNLGS